MRWLGKYWVEVVIGIVAIGVGVGLAYSARLRGNQPAGTSNQTPTYMNTKDNATNSVSNNTTTGATKKTGGMTSTLPPANQVPWGAGPSEQTPPTGGSSSSQLPNSAVPWGTGPSQQ